MQQSGAGQQMSHLGTCHLIALLLVRVLGAAIWGKGTCFSPDFLLTLQGCPLISSLQIFVDVVRGGTLVSLIWSLKEDVEGFFSILKKNCQRLTNSDICPQMEFRNTKATEYILLAQSKLLQN